MKNSKMDEKILETEYPELEYEDLLDEDKELIFFELSIYWITFFSWYFLHVMCCLVSS